MLPDEAAARDSARNYTLVRRKMIGKCRRPGRKNDGPEASHLVECCLDAGCFMNLGFAVLPVCYLRSRATPLSAVRIGYDIACYRQQSSFTIRDDAIHVRLNSA